MILESVLLFWVTRARLGLHVFIWRPRAEDDAALRRTASDWHANARKRRRVPRSRHAAPSGRRCELLGELRAEWRDLALRALEPNVFYEPAFALAAAPVFGARVGAVAVWAKGARPADRVVPGAHRAALRRDGDAHRLDPSLSRRSACRWSTATRPKPRSRRSSIMSRRIRACPSVLLLPMISRNGRFAAALARVLARRGGAMAPFGEHARAMLAPERPPRDLSRPYVAHEEAEGVAPPAPPPLR